MNRHPKYIVDGYVAMISARSFSGGWIDEIYGNGDDHYSYGADEYEIMKYNKMFSGELSKALIKKQRMDEQVSLDESLSKDKEHVYRLGRVCRKINRIIKKIDPRSKCGCYSLGVTFIKVGEEVSIESYDGQEGFNVKSDVIWIKVTEGDPESDNSAVKGYKTRHVLNRYNSQDDYLEFVSKVRADESESEYEEIIREPIEPMILIDRSIIETIDPKNSTRVSVFEMALTKHYFNIEWLKFSKKDSRIVVTKNTDVYSTFKKWNKMITVENLVAIVHQLQGTPKYGLIEETLIAKFHEKMEGEFGDVNRTTHVLRSIIMDRYFNLERCYHKLDEIFKEHRNHNDFNITTDLVHELQRNNYDPNLDFESDSD